MNLLTTFAGSMMEGFLPRGWDLARIDACCSHPARCDRRAPDRGGIPDFEPVPCDSVADFDVMMGHEIATAIQPHSRPRPAAALDPAGRPDGDVPLGGLLPQGMGRPVRPRPRLQHGRMERPRRRDASARATPARSRTRCRRRSTGRSGSRTVPESQRWFATADRLPHYAERIGELKAKGAELVVIFGIGRVCHIAFWEPHFAGEFASVDEWKAQTHRLGAQAASADDRAERPDQLQEPDDAGPRLRQHDRPGPLPPGRPDHRRRRRASSTAACSGRAPASG